MQWKKMDWPIMVDSLNLLGVSVVPLHILIDEHGIVRKTRARFNDLDEFLATEYEAPDARSARSVATHPPPVEQFLKLQMGDGAENGAINRVVASFEDSLTGADDVANGHFRLGVAYRVRFDSESRQPGDFENAINHWKAALDTNPNQYIWRRRIQQYGPRLDKPYSFYDWVSQARKEILARGEQPVDLLVEPTGSEIARPARALSTAENERAEPDPEARIDRDDGSFVRVETIVVPHTGRNADSVRVHVLFAPIEANKAHWNNEAQEMLVWISPPDGWQIDRHAHVIPNAATAVSGETRRIEFELRRVDDSAPATITVPGYALYNVCEDVDGVCLYRRGDFEVNISIGK